MEFLLLEGIFVVFAVVAVIWVKYDLSKKAEHKH